MSKRTLDWETVWEQFDAWYLDRTLEPECHRSWADLKDEVEKIVEAQLRQQNAA